MYAQAATAISEFWLSLAKDPALYGNFIDTLRASDTLSEHDRDRGYLVMDSYLSLLESYLLHNRQYGERQSQERWRPASDHTMTGRDDETSGHRQSCMRGFAAHRAE